MYSVQKIYQVWSVKNRITYIMENPRTCLHFHSSQDLCGGNITITCDKIQRVYKAISHDSSFHTTDVASSNASLRVELLAKVRSNGRILYSIRHVLGGSIMLEEHVTLSTESSATRGRWIDSGWCPETSTKNVIQEFYLWRDQLRFTWLLKRPTSNRRRRWWRSDPLFWFRTLTNLRKNKFIKLNFSVTYL